MTSCILSCSGGKFGHVVAVEPDYRIHVMLLWDVYAHLCTVNVVIGTVTPTAEYMPDFGHNLNGGYAIQISQNSESGDPKHPNEIILSSSVRQ